MYLGRVRARGNSTNIYIYFILLVFTKSVDSNFRAFWLAPVTRNILGYSLFWDGIQNGFSFRDSFERWNFSGNWSSRAKKYQERDKIGLVAVYCSVAKKFSRWICNKIVRKNDPRNTVSWDVRKQTLTKWRLLFTKSSFLIFIQLIGKILKQIPPSGLVHRARYIPRRLGI